MASATNRLSERTILSQRSKSPDVLDVLLESHGLYRKHIPRDGNSLFRCIADQVFGSQTFYPEVRKAILSYIWENKAEMEQIMSRTLCPEVSFIEYMIQKYLTATRAVFSSKIRVFREPILEKKGYFSEMSEDSFSGSPDIVLSVDSELRWDSIYTHEHMQTIAFSQSEVYKLLYKGVFKLKNVEHAVRKMLDKSKKNYFQTTRESKGQYAVLKLVTRDYSEFDSETDLKKLIDQGIPPFPYKVAKSLDANIYRNVEYDVWDSQRGPRSSGTGPECILQVGSKCVVHLKENIKCHGYVQQMMPLQGTILVFVEQLGEMREIPQQFVEPIRSSSGLALGPGRYNAHVLFSDGTWKKSRQSKDKNLSISSPTKITRTAQDSISNLQAVSEEKTVQTHASEEIQHSTAQAADYSENDTSTGSAGVDWDASEHQEGSNYGQEGGVDNNSYMENSPSYATCYPYYLQPVNLAANISVALDGSDLPYNDIATLRYFFNQGLQYIRSAYLSTGNCTMTAPTEECMGGSVVQVPAATVIPQATPGTLTKAIPMCQAHYYTGDTMMPQQFQGEVQMQPYMQEVAVAQSPPQGANLMEGTPWVQHPAEYQHYPQFFIATSPAPAAHPMMQHWPTAYPYTP